MSKWMAVVLLSGAGCSSTGGNADAGSTNDAGLTTVTNACSPDSSTYVGFLDISRSAFVLTSPVPHGAFLLGEDVRFFNNAPPYAPARFGLLPSVFCGDTPSVGRCCAVPLPLPPPLDAGDGATRVGPEYVTCLDDQRDPHSSTGMSDPYGGVNVTAWSGGDSLNCSVDGGVFGPFSTTVATPPDFVGLGEDAFPADGGSATISKDKSLSVTWTAGSASSNVVINLFGSTGGISCLGPDTGSFEVPSSFLTPFTSQEKGSITLNRYAATCVQGPNVQLSVLVENGVNRGVVFQ